MQGSETTSNAASVTVPATFGADAGNILPSKRKKKPRGAHARQVNERRLNKALFELRAKRLQNKMAMCVVCGKPFMGEDNHWRKDLELRSVGAWRIIVCQSHGRLDSAITIRGTPRFYEVPPAEAP